MQNFRQPKMIEIADPRLGPRNKKDVEDPKFVPYLFQINHQIWKRLSDGSIFRIFRSMLGPYKVQRICNPGVRDRRRRPESRERREILLTTTDRAAAVSLFNKGAQQ